MVAASGSHILPEAAFGPLDRGCLRRSTVPRSGPYRLAPRISRSAWSLQEAPVHAQLFAIRFRHRQRARG
eukprot:8447710-Alexandrium_andersonii.AAC.1